MKVLALSGSPRNGFCEEAINLIKKHFTNNITEFTIIKLAEVNILECKGCLACVKKGEEYCPLKDDRDFIIKEMQQSDGLIIASPANVFLHSLLNKPAMKPTLEQIIVFNIFKKLSGIT